MIYANDREEMVHIFLRDNFRVSLANELAYVRHIDKFYHVMGMINNTKEVIFVITTSEYDSARELYEYMVSHFKTLKNEGQDLKERATELDMGSIKSLVEESKIDFHGMFDIPYLNGQPCAGEFYAIQAP